MTPTPQIDRMQRASPCSQPWDKMQGDDRVRFCGRCKLNVYNVSELTRDELGQLVEQHEGRVLCVRMFERRDGTALTKDCPVGAFRRLLLWSAICTGVILLVAFVVGQVRRREPPFIGTMF